MHITDTHRIRLLNSWCFRILRSIANFIIRRGAWLDTLLYRRELRAEAKDSEARICATCRHILLLDDLSICEACYDYNNWAPRPVARVCGTCRFYSTGKLVVPPCLSCLGNCWWTPKT